MNLFVLCYVYERFLFLFVCTAYWEKMSLGLVLVPKSVNL